MGENKKHSYSAIINTADDGNYKRDIDVLHVSPLILNLKNITLPSDSNSPGPKNNAISGTDSDLFFAPYDR